MCPTFDHPVFTSIRQRILTGHWQPGAALKPEEIACELRVSVTPVREALIRLCERELVDRGHKSGFNVPQFETTKTAHYCKLVSILYSDSLNKIRDLGLENDIAEAISREMKLIADKETCVVRRCHSFIQLLRIRLLAKPYNFVVEHTGDVIIAHESATIGSITYYEQFLSEMELFVSRHLSGDIELAFLAIEQSFSRRAEEINQAAYKLSLLSTPLAENRP
jgi:DNA-binding GntR family transcriptional regulator